MRITCKVCHDTGHLPGSNDLDCASCETATQRVMLETWAKEQGMRIDPDQLWAVFRKGQESGLEMAIEKLDSINDKAGDRAAYDGDEMTMYETERMHAFANAVEAIESLKP